MKSLVGPGGKFEPRTSTRCADNSLCSFRLRHYAPTLTYSRSYFDRTSTAWKASPISDAQTSYTVDRALMTAREHIKGWDVGEWPRCTGIIRRQGAHVTCHIKRRKSRKALNSLESLQIKPHFGLEAHRTFPKFRWKKVGYCSTDSARFIIHPFVSAI